MSTKTSTGKYHFSPALRDWAKCDAKIRCRLDHVSESEYQVIQNIKAEEATMLDSNLGKAEISYINAKTSMDITDIQETLRELRREGSRLPTPTAEELEAFLEQEKFKVENDSTLSNKERRQILKSLREAEKDLNRNQDGITGGVLHAWRNGLTASLARIRKPLLVGALAGGLAFGLAACAPNTAPAPTPEKNDKETVQVEEEECVDATVSGDVIPGELTSNSSGEYCQVVINPDSAALVYDKSKVDTTLYDMGYTDEQLENMQKKAVEDAVTVIDSPMAGQEDAEAVDWITNKGDTHFQPEVAASYLVDGGNEYGQRGYDIAFSTSKTLPPLVYNGDSRIEQVSITVDRIQPRTLPALEEVEAGSAETPDAEVVLIVNTSYRVAPETYKQWREDIMAPIAEMKDKSHLLEEVLTSNFANLDTAKPMFFDREAVMNIGYTEDYIKSQENMKIRSQIVRIDGADDWLARN